MKNGSFFQAYPTHLVFASQTEWMNHWKTTSNATFVEEGYEDMPPLESYRAMPPLEEVPTYPTPVAPVAAPVAPVAPVAAVEEDFTDMPHLEGMPTQITTGTQCYICTGPLGQDHRMCLIQMLRDGVEDVVNEWSRRSGFDSVAETAPAPAPSPAPVARTPPPTPALISPPRLAKKRTRLSLSSWTYEYKLSTVVPPGTYYIGDICYFLDDDIYETIFGGHGYESGLYTRKSDASFFMVDNTLYGDGLYEGTDGFGYAVDAGIIGIVSMPLAATPSAASGGKIHTFREPVEIKFGKGLFRFKSHSEYLAIDTKGSSYNSDEDW